MQENFQKGLFVPPEWDSVDHDVEFTLVSLDNRSVEYQNIVAAVTKSAFNVEIESIQRVQNSLKYQQYCLLKEKLLHGRKSNFVVEKELFHGTKETNVPGICSDGFNRSLAGKNGTTYGNGSYFARDFTKSMKYGRKVFYAKVLTGVYTQGNKSLLVAPDFDLQKGIKYDSVVDNLTNPSIYVVFSDNHAYPAYVITYKADGAFFNANVNYQATNVQPTLLSRGGRENPQLLASFVQQNNLASSTENDQQQLLNSLKQRLLLHHYKANGAFFNANVNYQAMIPPTNVQPTQLSSGGHENPQLMAVQQNNSASSTENDRLNLLKQQHQIVLLHRRNHLNHLKQVAALSQSSVGIPQQSSGNLGPPQFSNAFPQRSSVNTELSQLSIGIMSSIPALQQPCVSSSQQSSGNPGPPNQPTDADQLIQFPNSTVITNGNSRSEISVNRMNGSAQNAVVGESPTSLASQQSSTMPK